MGGVVVLHPQDVLNYNRMPLISIKGSNNPTFIPNYDYSNPKFAPNPNPKSSSNSNRRKRSPHKKNNDVSRSPPLKSSNLGNTFEGGNGFLRSSPLKNSNFGHNFDSGNGLKKSPMKGVGGNLSRGKISSAHKLEMGKVKILKRGEALTSDDKVEKKMVSFDEQEKDEKMVILRENDMNLQKNYEKIVALSENDKHLQKKDEKKIVILRENDRNLQKKDEKIDTLRENDNNLQKKDENIVSLRENDKNLESIEMMLMRLGPEPEMVPKQINLADFYAGSAVVTSPDPSSVPVPDFFKKKTQEIIDPSSHLRMLLNLTF
ncbi:hypothetical protein LIER_36825 [Lithospermum erythrorhizon]|uniref:Uncharacterized protein n=1 Tax=Lithospermum erythrorhizon TaxID=34254 RepID=A0AAV3PB23_LITER